MASEWAVLNSVAERDEDANPDFPWYPYLFIPEISGGLGFSIWFATEEECRDFIKEHVLGATLEEQ